MLPNFIHAGVPKSGSGTIEKILRTHPQVFTPRPKELNFFNVESSYAKGLEWYRETYFHDVAKQKIICDNSIGYSTGFSVRAIHRMKVTLGDEIKILLTLRHPVDRAYSQFCMAKYKGQIEPMNFADAVEDALQIEGRFSEEELLQAAEGRYYSSTKSMSIYRYCMYVAPGLYANTLRQYADAFGRDNVLVLFLEDIRDDLVGQLDTLCRFLEIDSISVDPNCRHNESQTLRYPVFKRMYNKVYSLGFVRKFVNQTLDLRWRRRLRKALMSWNYCRNEAVPAADPVGQARLQARYMTEMRTLQDLTGRDLSGWLDKYPLGNGTL